MYGNSHSPLVSIVVPMYKTERYLSKCVESIRAQTLEDIEVILVDDGSPDACGRIADNYSELDPRVKVVHRANGGLGPARNSGMQVASGKYIGFVDSDDWIEPEMYEQLICAAESVDADVAIGGMKVCSHDSVSGVFQHPYAGKTFRGAEEIFKVRRSFYGALPERVKVDQVPVSVWRALYRRSILFENDIWFQNVRSEDKFFNTLVCRCAQIVTCVPGAHYCYRKDDQPSITKTFTHETVASFFELFDLLERMASEEPECFIKECSLRAKRCVIDYTRTLLMMIEKSSENEEAKSSYVTEALASPSLKRASEGYPYWRLPFAQAIFFLVMKSGNVRLARLLVRLRGGMR